MSEASGGVPRPPQPRITEPAKSNEFARYETEYRKVTPPIPINYDALPESTVDRSGLAHESFRSPNVEKWVDNLPDAQPEDENLSYRLWKETGDLEETISWYQRNRGEEWRTTEEGKRYQELMARREEVEERSENAHLKEWLPRQIAEMLMGPGVLAMSPKPDEHGNYKYIESPEMISQIAEAIREGNMEAIHKGLRKKAKPLRERVGEYEEGFMRRYTTVGPGEFYRPGDPAWFRNQPRTEIYVPGTELYERDQNIMNELEKQLRANRWTQGILEGRYLVPTVVDVREERPLDRPWTEIVGTKAA